MHFLLLIDISCQASLSVTVLDSFTSDQLGHSSARKITIERGTVYSMPLALPSIMALDAELVEEFFNNVIANAQLLYDRSTYKISLCLKE